MNELFDAENSAMEAEVERRIRALRERPTELLERFDQNQDGVLDRSEWAALRRVISDEVLAEQDDSIDHERFECDTLAGRYDRLAMLGRGAQGQTFLARDRQSQDMVAIKILNVEGVTEWKHYELLEREARVLGTLDHKSIPALLDSFETDVDGKPGIAIVQEYIPGDNLEYRLAAGELFTEDKLRRLAEDLLVILSYLHRLDPPIIHRDVKPSNVIVNDSNQTSLVDFGAVQIEGTAQDTVVGTTGYMPPEQVMSRPVLSSDLYSLGATLVHLATRKHPSELPSQRMKLDWRGDASVSDGFADFLDTLIEPAVERRFQSTAEALKALENVRLAGAITRVSPSSQQPAVQPPRTSLLTRNDALAEHRRNDLEIVLRTSEYTLREGPGELSIEYTPSMFMKVGMGGLSVLFALGGIGLLALISQEEDMLALPWAFLILGVGTPLLGWFLWNSLRGRVVDLLVRDNLVVRVNGVIEKTCAWSQNPGIGRTKNQSTGQVALELNLGEDTLLIGGVTQNFDNDASRVVSYVNAFLETRGEHTEARHAAGLATGAYRDALERLKDK